jgi:hypothetical protein
MPPELEGWQSVESRGTSGEIVSDQRVRTSRPVVDASERGARELGDRYWAAVVRASKGAVRPRTTAGGVELRLLGRGPTVLRFGPPELAFDAERVACTYPIRGGMLTRRPGGAITLSQSAGAEPELSAAVVGFVPRLGSRAYERVQRRLHLAASRAYFRSLLAGAGS